MFHAQFFEELGGGTGASGLHVLIPPANAFHGLLVVLPLPFKVGCHHFIKRGGGVLAVTLRVILKLRSSLGFQGNGVCGVRFHARQCRGKGAEVSTALLLRLASRLMLIRFFQQTTIICAAGSIGRARFLLAETSGQA